MMIIQNLRRAFSALLLASVLALPAWAQLSPMLQATNETDFLDIFQSTANKTLKPEIATCYDFSGSMNRFMFHPLYPNEWPDEDADSIQSRYLDIYVTIDAGGTAVTNVALGQSSPGATSVTISGVPYTIGGAPGTTGGVAYNTLIKPDGTPVTLLDVSATVGDPLIPYSSNSGTWPYSGGVSKEAVNWVRCASHIRVKCSNPSGVIRYVDLPLNWAVLPLCNWTGALAKAAYPDPSNVRCTATYPITFPLPRETVKDPKTGISYDIDTNYKNVMTGNVPLQRRSATVASIGNTTGSTVMLYRSRYLEWVFYGQDASGAYWIPDAIQSLKAVDPLSVTGGKGAGAFTYITDFRQAFGNGLPNRNRIQAIKEATVRTFLKYQDTVFWAFRSLAATGGTLDQTTGTSGAIPVPTDNNTSGNQTWYLLNGNTATGMGRLAALVPSGATPLTQSHADMYSELQNVNPWAAVEVNNIPSGGVDDRPVQCMKHFMILFTDGAPNESPMPSEGLASNFPYINLSAPYTSTAKAGNTIIKGSLTGLNSGSTFWNSPTLSAVAAHLGNTSLGAAASVDPGLVTYPASTGAASAFAPFYIKKRGTGSTLANFSPAHPIETMTVGVSLGVNWLGSPAHPINPYATPAIPVGQDKSSAKFRLMATAALGDPDKGYAKGDLGTDLAGDPVPPTDLSWDFSKIIPFTLTDPLNPFTSAVDPNSVSFFDGSDPTELLVGLDRAFSTAVAKSQVTVAAAPTVPFVGLGLSNQIYLGTFNPPSTGGPIWSGDLMMFATATNPDGSVNLVDSTLAKITDPKATNAQWAASNIFNGSGANRKWYSRVIWTRLPATLVAPNPGLIRFSDADPVFSVMKASFAPALLTDAAKQTLIQRLLGADTSSITTPRTSIPNLSLVLGDIVDSTPNVAEYDLNDLTIVSGLASASPYLFGKLPIPLPTDYRFRVVFVGDNLGFLHAFGEVTHNKLSNPFDPGSPKVTTGWVDELWAYYPTDFLQNPDYYNTKTNSHRFTVDGSPFIYHLDLPAAGTISGDGKVNNLNFSVDTGEQALVVFGLRKGGRSYYALDIRDPFTPKLGPNGTNASSSNKGWALVPDEAAFFQGSRIETGQTVATVSAVLGKMGFSSSIPAVGRVVYGSSRKLRDVVFLGGGYSTPEVEHNFPVYPPPAVQQTPLGRSAWAVEVTTGNILGLWDLTSTGMGPVAAGIVPFEFFPNSGLVQRAYFNDLYGGLWALGSAQLQASTSAPDFGKFRLDSSALDHWTDDGTSKPAGLAVRKIYSLSKNNGLLSTLPAPFTTANFPITRDKDPKVTPAVVGIALESGNRYNPVDRFYTGVNIKPTQHRLTVIWDRQDSELLGLNPAGITDSRLVDMTGQSTEGAPIITPSNTSYYLKAQNPTDNVGYFINFPAASDPTFVTKGISQPIVLSYVMLFSYFTPTAFDPCVGALGETISNRVCNVVLPVVSTADVSAVSNVCTSGVTVSWYGVASDFTAKNNISALQGGNLPTSGAPPPGGGVATVVSIQTITGNQSGRFPKPRVWRVVH